MAFITGTSTDYKDLLNDLRDYIISAPAGSNWVVERDTSGGAPDKVEMIFKGNGGATDEIYWGVETFYNAGAGYYNWQLKAFTGFDTNATFGAQPGYSPSTYVPLQNTTMDYWFFVSGRRICVVIKTGSAYQFLYAGFIDAYASPDEYPYPMLVMGCTSTSTTVWNSNDINYSSSVAPGPATSYLRDITGQWLQVQNFTGTQWSTSGVQVWPLCEIDTLDSYEDASVHTYFGNTYAGGTPDYLMFRTVNPGGDPVVPLISTCLVRQTATTQLYGEIHNVSWCPLSDTVSAEDTITDGITLDVYTVFQNVHRTDPWCGLAIKQE